MSEMMFVIGNDSIGFVSLHEDLAKRLLRFLFRTTSRYNDNFPSTAYDVAEAHYLYTQLQAAGAEWNLPEEELLPDGGSPG